MKSTCPQPLVVFQDREVLDVGLTVGFLDLDPCQPRRSVYRPSTLKDVRLVVTVSVGFPLIIPAALSHLPLWESRCQLAGENLDCDLHVPHFRDLRSAPEGAHVSVQSE